MDNPEKLETVGTQDTGRRQTQHKKTTKTMSKHGTKKKTGMQLENNILLFERNSKSEISVKFIVS